MQTLKIQLYGARAFRINRDGEVEVDVEDSGGKVSPVGCITVKGDGHSEKAYGLSVTENGAVRTYKVD